jgi:hypothetical protein
MLGYSFDRHHFFIREEFGRLYDHNHRKGKDTARVQGDLFFCFNHTVSKLYSLWHIGYLLDDFYGLHICSRMHLLLYNPARRPASTEPPGLSGSTPSYFPIAVMLDHILTPRHSPLPLLPLRLFCQATQRPTSRLYRFRLPASCLLRSSPRIRACPL